MHLLLPAALLLLLAANCSLLLLLRCFVRSWIECVGLADRSAYDLTAHTAMSKQELTAHERFDEPKMVDMLKVGLMMVTHGLCCYRFFVWGNALTNPRWWSLSR